MLRIDRFHGGAYRYLPRYTPAAYTVSHKVGVGVRVSDGRTTREGGDVDF